MVRSVTFAHLPTPLESADRLGAALRLEPGRLWIKRDDCTGLATGGNKARKIALLVGDAVHTGCDVLVTAGGLQSNHARTTAAAAARAGMGCVLAFNSDPPERIEANQLLDVILGAERRFVGPIAMDDLNVVVERIADELRAIGRKPYVIPVGGSSPLGASAYVVAADEILADLGHDDLLVVTATASGGTHAGLAARLGHERVLGVDVGALADPIAAVRRLAIEVAALRGRRAPTGEPWLVRDQVGDGYGAVTTACREAIRLAARAEGLLLDPVYSGKALAGLMALPPGELESKAIVFLATGGVPALFASHYAGWLTEDSRIR
jgi:1-aminocyclopropane-1-carboxylate deaminase/D-cysteine desulfhydrase-like pyridoxal-dependent ACC family enzyme